MKKGRKKPEREKSVSSSAELAEAPGWTFLTNHTHVLLCLYRNPDITLRQVATLVGITERMVQKIVAELVNGGFADVTRVGRRNSYAIRTNLKLRHPLESHHSIGELLELLGYER